MKLDGKIVTTVRLKEVADSLPKTSMGGDLVFSVDKQKGIEMVYSDGNGVLVHFNNMTFLLPLGNIKALVFK